MCAALIKAAARRGTIRRWPPQQQAAACATAGKREVCALTAWQAVTEGWALLDSARQCKRQGRSGQAPCIFRSSQPSSDLLLPVL